MRRWLGLLSTVAILGIAWYFLAPPQLGGKTSYAVTFGISMEPHFHHGDLVMLRRRDAYHVGQVVAYRSHDLHRNVLHRIVAVADGHFTFKGDNNSFVDPEHPTARDLVGAEWLRLPAVGNWLASLHSPRNAAIAAFLIVLTLTAGGGGAALHRRRRGDRSPREPREPRGNPVPPSVGVVVAAPAAGALCAAAVLGAIAFTHPLERPVVRAGLYVQRGTFSYAAHVEPGAAYQKARVTSGDPVYLQLVHRLPVAFAYRLRGARHNDVHGTARLAAVVTDGEGWRHRIVLAPARRFDGPAAVLRGTLDLRRLERVVADFERETGENNPVYKVDLHANVSISGTVDARPISTHFAPTLHLDLDALRLAPSSGSASGAAPNAFSQSQSGAGTHLEPAMLHAFGRSITVERARRAGGLLGIAGLVLALVGGLLMLLGRKGGEVDAICRRYEQWIVDVMPDPERAAGERRVSSMAALARIAERYDRLILHERRGDSDAFVIDDHGVVYAYVVRNWSRSTALAVS